MKQIAKKSLALLLAVCFMLTTAIVALPLSVSAAEATKCATWAEVVAAVEADSAASIKLTNHVTANSTIASFAGTFDGNGYTVTVEKTMFTALADGAVLKNFQTTAAAAISEAPIAVTASGTVTFTNVINNVSVSGTGIGQMGGFLTTTAGTTTVNMTSCVNNGNIQTNNQASGIIGNTEGTLTVNFTDVVNNGDITGNKNYAGGIVCSNGALTGTMNRVINNGDIYVESTVSGQKGSDAAGLIGTAKGKATVTLTECVNTGAVTLVTTNTSAHYGVAGFAIRTDDTSSVFTFDKCVNTGVLTSETAPANDAIAVPLKSGAASATNCTYSSGTSTIAGATKVDAATAEASIAAIKAKMTLPTFDANKAPETDTPAGGDTPDFSERFSFFIDAGFATVTVDGPKYMKVGDLDAITVTFDVPGKGTNSVGAGFVSSDTTVVDFPGPVVVTTDTGVHLNDVTHNDHTNSAFSCWTDQGVANEVVITIPVSALAAGISDITLLDIEDGYLFTFCDADMANIYQYDSLDIGYSITVVEETTDEPDFSERFAFFIDAGFATVTVDGPKYMKVGDLDAITVTFDVPGKGTNSVGAGFVSSKTTVVDFPGPVVVTTDTGVHLNDVTHNDHTNSAFSCWTDQGVANEVVITIPVSALAAGTSDITLLDIEDGYLFTFCDADMANIYQYDSLDIGYSITVVEETTDEPDEPADNSTTLDATTGTLTVTGPATAVAGESFDVTFTWADYGFTPDTIDLNFFLNTITSQTQAGNIAVSAIKSTNFTSYSEDVFGYADNTNLFKIGLTNMTGVGDTVEIVVTFSSTTPGYTGFSLQYAALSNETGTGYTEIANYDKTPDYEEAYVIELTVPETSHTVIFMDGDTTLNTSKNVAYGSLLADVYTAPAKEGYTFNGWKDASGAPVTTVTGDITVYADYSVNEYTVNITVVNGTATNATQTLDYAGSIDATVNAALAAAGLAPATGYTDSYTVSAPSVSGTTIAVTVTYTTKLTYTVEFVGFEGADLGSVTVEHGAAATAPTVPAVEGYTFTGWDKDFNNVTGNLTVNAVYEINKYTVKFVGYNNADLGSFTVEHGAAATAPSAPAVEGYTFKNWDKTFDKVTGDLTVTAVYEINKYTVKFVGYNDADLGSVTVEHGAAATAPTVPAVEGYTFTGWDKAFNNVTSDLTVNAEYTINSYNVTVSVKAEGDYAKTTANYNTEYTLPTEDEVRAKGLLTTDDIFSGWMINGESFDEGAKVTITADTVITAILGNVTYYTVTIVDGATTTNSYAEGTTFTVPAAAGQTGYTFVNWTDDEGNVYTADQTVTVTADITLTANYKINTYTVKFVGFNGADLGSVTVEHGKKATAPTAPAVEGYTFNDWDTDFSSVTSDLTVTALYTINSYDIVITDHDGTTKTVKANYGENVLDVVNANYTKDSSLVFLGFYNHNGTLISSTGKVTARTLVYVAYTVENILVGGNDNIVIGDGIITYYAGADADAFTYGTVAKNGGTGDTITFTAPLLVADAVADLISFNAETATYTIIVMGDVDGDADVDTDDAARVADQMLDSTTLTGHFYTAANTTYPTALITARDIAAIKAFAKGTITAFAK